jgi:hypothetical protein
MTGSRTTQTTIATALALASLFTASATAMPYREGNNRGSTPIQGTIAAAASQPASAPASTPAPSSQVVRDRYPRGGMRPEGTLGRVDISARARASAQSDFHWGDAGIGAAGVLALATIAVGAGLAVTSRKHRAVRPA